MQLAASERRVPGIYRLGARIDGGNTDEVYEASHPRLPGRFAIKFLGRARTAPAEAREACLQEAAVVARLSHPHIAYLLEIAGSGWGPRDGLPYLVMEYLEGETLEVQLAGRALPISQVLAIVKGIASALEAAHEVNVIHGELRPGKVFMVRAAGYEIGFPKLLDFGLWRLGAQETGLELSPEAARYLAPELAAARFDELDGRADQFALAALAYRLISRVDAFPGDDTTTVLRGVMHDEPPSLLERVRIDSLVDAVIRQGLAKDPGQRYPTVLAFARALEESVASSPPDTTQIVHSRDVMQSAVIPAVIPVAEMDDEVSSSFFAEGERQEKSGVYAEPVPIYKGPLDRVPHRRWPAVLVLFALLAGGAGAAWWTGWRPPAEWQRQWSRLVEKLQLPAAPSR
jgi:serine/threonine-protein kinase